MSRGGWIGAALLALAVAAGLLAAPRVLLAGWLAVWWWCLGLVLGCFVNAWMHRLTGGDWGAPLRGAALALGRCCRGCCWRCCVAIAMRGGILGRSSGAWLSPPSSSRAGTLRAAWW